MSSVAHEPPQVEVTAGTRAFLEGRQLPGYIAVEGPIGVGKTTLANKLAQTFGYTLLREPAEENPFLDRFYREGKRHALPTQLFFLLHRTRQVTDIREQDLLGLNLVADFLMEKDALFARLTLDDNEFALYQQIRQSLSIDAPRPELVIYLQAPAEVLLRRIHSRGVDFEQRIGADYLNMLINSYTEFFHFYTDAPLLVVNATEIDFANNPSHFDALLAQIVSMDGPRQYFNPHPQLI